MDLDRKRFMLFLPLLFTVILFGCDGSDGSSSTTPTSTPGAYTENDFVADPTLRIPITKTAVTFLEPPNAVEEVDTYKPGADTVPYYIQEPGEYTFCWRGDTEGDQHYMYLQDSTGKEVLQVSVDEGCVTAAVGIGNYTMFIVHDGLTAEVEPIFVVVGSGQDEQSIQPQYNKDDLNILLNTRSCSGCDLTEANLTGADLTEANLTDANLSNANLTDAHLEEANLTGADLTEANLTDANLTPANLTGAVLTRANLWGAFLLWANLTGADLTEANLTDADLSNANLTMANLRDANLRDAELPGADLSGATWVDGRVCAEGSIGSCDFP